ncbi:MAG: tRNA (adenosine(37)-N6)-dimethylallyltransferase MiaA [Aureispira sp.]|nr:tRNA (adenosine(37)-N6)-dimethylallyltransferase MiaA [Aureispira sp.]
MIMASNKYLLVICGPTASGKTSLSIDLAKHFGSEILSCDSRQFFKEMSIGTAKPNAGELAAAKHHFVDSLSINEFYTIGDFERDVITFLDGYFLNHDIAIMVGGSGMYIKAVCEGIDDYPDVDPNIRTELNQLFKEKGLEALQTELKELDPTYFSKVDLNNHQRIIRALEICKSTGKPFSSFQNKNKIQRPFEVLKIGINWDREKLYERINYRVDLMLEEGLEQEAKELYPQRALNALQTVGYQELFSYFSGEITKEKAIELIKRNTRRYAKRQMTWFRRDTDLEWFDAPVDANLVINWVESQLTKN